MKKTYIVLGRPVFTRTGERKNKGEHVAAEELTNVNHAVSMSLVKEIEVSAEEEEAPQGEDETTSTTTTTGGDEGDKSEDVKEVVKSDKVLELEALINEQEELLKAENISAQKRTAINKKIQEYKAELEIVLEAEAQTLPAPEEEEGN